MVFNKSCIRKMLKNVEKKYDDIFAFKLVSLHFKSYFCRYYRALIIKLNDEIHKRITFGIISHSDAGKTPLTEKLLLFGGAIQPAGAVKSNKIKKHAPSDFMEIERQRGISVA